ncbi:MAG: RNA polymerase sigma factor [Phycisphaerales bacterium]
MNQGSEPTSGNETAGNGPGTDQAHTAQQFLDQSLPVQAAIAGHSDALSQVWVGVRRWVAAILIAHKPREADLEDLLQLVALQLCRKIHEVRDPALFKPWLRTVTINIAREQGRKVSRKRVGMLKLVGRHKAETTKKEIPTQIGNMMLSEDATRVLDAALSLPEKYREPVLMRCQQSMSYKQIAQVLSLPETTIETRIARGRKMLRQAIELQKENQQQNQSDLNQSDLNSSQHADTHARLSRAGGVR